ncbi:TPA: GIY-YIG nuclease family protein [Stenotrophomonas maltophilia]|uniref:GIY-YIG nuclease family protein n=1 Tax=unclassified Stenotrophomonas TaxID=196198 RepID=UPI00104F0CF2|nr:MULTISPECIES: GIY-YIG nuclease family protein [unclassified Stenotrophomonas]MDH1232114.1 GIY-YIG nuclease family protein [Stenotrophomonas sp. GD03930]QBL40506.1 GIY-YIG nuclease family protein [Stenotrophomonas sp. ASS1]DAE50459.1 MAG TPA: Meiotically up-regulated protein 113 [Caudoviricetes sp.]
MKMVVYMMIADACCGDSFCKIGVTTDLAARVSAVQTGCPMPITDVAYLELPRGARQAETLFHSKLQAFHTQGEWFRMNLSNPDHKRAMAEATAVVLRHHGLSETRWKHMSLDAVRSLCRVLRLDNAA